MELCYLTVSKLITSDLFFPPTKGYFSINLLTFRFLQKGNNRTAWWNNYFSIVVTDDSRICASEILVKMLTPSDGGQGVANKVFAFKRLFHSIFKINRN